MSYSVPFIYITEGGHTAHQGHGRGILWREPNLLPSQTVRQIQPVQHPIPPYNGPIKLDHDSTKDREHGTIRKTQRRGNHGTKKLHPGVQSQAGHSGASWGKGTERDCCRAGHQSQYAAEMADGVFGQRQPCLR